MTALEPARDYSPTGIRLFHKYARIYFRRHFTALRVRGTLPDDSTAPRTIFYSNHPSWWDPIVMILIARGLLSRTRMFAPIEAEALSRYPLLRRLGLFPLDAGSVHGLRRFMKHANGILDAGDCLAVTAQGRFEDHRQRPIRLRGGIGHLLSGRSERIAVPVAIEYGFWNSRLPEALVSFGEPVRIPAAATPRDATAALERGLSRELDALQAIAVQRDERRFTTLVGRDRSDVDGIYGLIRRLRPAGARLSGR